MTTFLSQYENTPTKGSLIDDENESGFMSPGFNAGESVIGTTIVELDELGFDEREEMLKFLVQHDIQFRKEEDGMYAADIQIVKPVKTKNETSTKHRRRSRSSLETPNGANQKIAYANGTLYRRASRPPEDMKRVLCAMEEAERLFDYSCYPRLSALVSQHGVPKARRRTVGWVMRTIEDLYDARQSLATPEVENPENTESFRLSRIFPVFVVDKFAKQYGLRKLVDQTCWDLMYNVHGLRKSYQEIEIFARFIEEFYDPEELVFFLYARSIVQRELKLTFRQEWVESGSGSPGNVFPKHQHSTTKKSKSPLRLSLREAQIIAKLIFGTDSNKLYSTFMHEVKSKMNKGKHINAMKFLHLALLRYHKLKPDRNADDGVELEERIEKSEDTQAEDSSANVSVATVDVEPDEASKTIPSHDMPQKSLEEEIEQMKRDQIAVEEMTKALESSRFESEVSPLLKEDLSRERFVEMKSPNSKFREAERQENEISDLDSNTKYTHTDEGSQVTNKSPKSNVALVNPFGTRSVPTVDRAFPPSPHSSTSPTYRTQAQQLGLVVPSYDMTPTEEVYAELRSRMKETREQYLTALMESAKMLPADVYQEIETEVGTQLQEKTDSILTTITGAPLSPRKTLHVHTETCHRVSGSCLFKQFEMDFRAILHRCHEMGGLNAEMRNAIHALTRQVLQSPNLRQEVEPLVALLVTYATARLDKT